MLLRSIIIAVITVTQESERSLLLSWALPGLVSHCFHFYFLQLIVVTFDFETDYQSGHSEPNDKVNYLVCAHALGLQSGSHLSNYLFKLLFMGA